MSTIKTACFSFSENEILEYARDLMLSGEWSRAVELVREGHVNGTIEEMEASLRGDHNNPEDEDYIQELGEVYDHIVVGKKKVRVESYVNVTTALQKMKKDYVFSSRFSQVNGPKNIDFAKQHLIQALKRQYCEYENFVVFDLRTIKDFRLIQSYIQEGKQKSVHDEYLILGESLETPYFLSPSESKPHFECNLNREIDICEILDLYDFKEGEPVNNEDSFDTDLDLTQDTGSETSSNDAMSDDEITAKIENWRSEILEQANGDLLTIEYEFDGKAKAVEVPRACFERWALQKPKLFFLASPWNNIAPHDFKMARDNRDHSDWMIATGIDLDRAIMNGEYRALNKAASLLAFELLDKMTKYEAVKCVNTQTDGDFIIENCSASEHGITGTAFESTVAIVGPGHDFEVSTDIVFEVKDIMNADVKSISFLVTFDNNRCYLLIGA